MRHVRYRRSLIATLQEQDVSRVGTEQADAKLMPFLAAVDGETVSGTFTSTAQLSSGKFAIVEKSYEFTLVPWRPVNERHLGREVTGVVLAGSLSVLKPAFLADKSK